MCDHYTYHRGDTPDSLDEFLAQLLADIPEFLPTSITIPPLPPPPSTSAQYPASASAPAFHHATTPHTGLTCQWVSTDDPLLVCGTPLSTDSKLACTHFRHAHDLRGNEKVIVYCHWRDCQVPPMQRGSLIRHLLSVHLGLLRWQCEVCGKVFSRKGTGHACAEMSESG